MICVSVTAAEIQIFCFVNPIDDVIESTSISLVRVAINVNKLKIRGLLFTLTLIQRIFAGLGQINVDAEELLPFGLILTLIALVRG